MSSAVRYQYMPPLSPEEYTELEESIRTYGVIVPILRDARGVVIDGHHRLRIAESLDIDCPTEYLDDRSDTELRTLAFELNLNRRHLTRLQRRELVAESIKADPELSSREHGRRTGVHHTTAESVRESLSATGEISQLPTRTGADGRSRNLPNPSASAPPPSPSAVRQLRREQAEADGAAFIHEINRITSPDTAAWAAEDDRRRSAALRLVAPCEQLVKNVSDPEAAAKLMPSDYRQHIPTVQAALTLLTRFLNAVEDA